LGGSGSGFARSVASLIPTQNLRHIFAALQTQSRGKNGFMPLRLLVRRQKRRKQPERYVQFALNLLTN
jgi:hypothetical protein